MHADNKYNFTIIAIAIMSLYMVSRFVCLDADLPPLKVSSVQPIEELVYSINGFNLYHYGSIAPEVVPGVPPDGFALNFTEAIAVWPFLHLFGNNYYGLRASSVFAGLICLLCLALIFRSELKSMSSHVKTLSIVAALLLLMAVINFQFTVATKFFGPTINRVALLCLLLYFIYRVDLTKNARHWIFSLSVGFIACVITLFGNTYNPFMSLALFLFLVICGFGNGWKTGVKNLVFASIGGVLGVLTFAAYAEFINFNMSFIEFLRYLAAAGGEHSSLPYDSSNIFLLFKTNFFAYDLGLLFVFLCALPFYVFHCFSSKRDRIDYFMVILIGMFVLQSLKLSGCFDKKYIVMLPVVLFVIFRAAQFLMRTKADLFVDRYSPLLRTTIKANYIFGIYVLYVFFAFALCLKVYASFTYWDGLSRYLWPLVLSILLIGALGVLIVTLIHGKVNLRSCVFLLLILTAILPSVWYQYRHFYRDIQFRYRDMMISLAPKFNGKIVAGSLSHCVRLYNTSVPILSRYYYKWGENYRRRYWQSIEKVFNNGIAEYLVCINVPKYIKTYSEAGFVIDGPIYDLGISEVDQFIVFKPAKGVSIQVHPPYPLP